MENRYIYGPVPSRRLGFSVGIDLVPFKTCTYDCIYCQLGKTTNKTYERREYITTEDLLNEIKHVVKVSTHIDYLTFSGSGEPTLHSGIGNLINAIKQITKIPVAVLTNGSLLFMPDVQNDVSEADVVLPTLCTANQEIFQRINRPHPVINIKRVVQGLISFRERYKGKIWLEVMLVKGMNNSLEEINNLRDIIKKIRPDKVHLNTVVRPPSEKSALPLLIEEMQRIRGFLGESYEVIAEFSKIRERTHLIDKEDAILNLLKRRPATMDDIANALGIHKNLAIKCLHQLKQERKIKSIEHNNKIYYEPS